MSSREGSRVTLPCDVMVTSMCGIVQGMWGNVMVTSREGREHGPRMRAMFPRRWRKHGRHRDATRVFRVFPWGTGWLPPWGWCMAQGAWDGGCLPHVHGHRAVRAVGYRHQGRPSGCCGRHPTIGRPKVASSNSLLIGRHPASHGGWCLSVPGCQVLLLRLSSSPARLPVVQGQDPLQWSGSCTERPVPCFGPAACCEQGCMGKVVRQPAARPPASCGSQPCTRQPAPAEHGSRNTGLALNTEHGTRNTEHTKNTEHRSLVTGHGTRNTEKEHGTRNTGHGISQAMSRAPAECGQWNTQP